MSLEEEFLITVDEEEETIRVTIEEARVPGKRFWQWIKKGIKTVFNVSISGVASTTNTIKDKIQDELGGDWELDSISLTLSKSPSAIIVLSRED